MGGVTDIRIGTSCLYRTYTWISEARVIRKQDRYCRRLCHECGNVGFKVHSNTCVIYGYGTNKQDTSLYALT